jgi:hypothetical protein
LRLSAEAMRQLKPQEVRCLLLLAEGHSYKQICAITGWTYTNLYRLIRVRLDEESGELDRFLDAEGGDVPEYQAALVLLAVIIAFPDEASEFLLGLGDLDTSSDADRRSSWRELSWREHITTLKSRPGGRWGELARFLDEVTAEAKSGERSTREPFRRWALELSRYSFATGQEVFSRYHAGRHLQVPLA